MGKVKDHSVKEEPGNTITEHQLFMHSLLRQKSISPFNFLSEICKDMQPVHI